MNNKKLFKGALVLFASILMAVSCSKNEEGGSNTPTTPETPSDPAKVTVTAEELQTFLTETIAAATKGKIDFKVDENDADVHLDLTSLKISATASKDNAFDGGTSKASIKNDKGSSDGTAVSAAKNITVNDKLQTAISAAIVAKKSNLPKGATVEENNTVVTKGAGKTATAVFTFKQNNATATVTFSIDVDTGVAANITLK